MDGVIIGIIILLLCGSICICSDDCCCELCKDICCHNNELTDKLNEISKVSSPIQDTQSTHIEV